MEMWQEVLLVLNTGCYYPQSLWISQWAEECSGKALKTWFKVSHLSLPVITNCTNDCMCDHKVLLVCDLKNFFLFVCCVADEEEVGPWTWSSAVSFRQKALSEVRTRKSCRNQMWDVGCGKAAIRADIGPYSDVQESGLAVLSGWAGSGTLSSCHHSHDWLFSQISEEAHDGLHLPCSVGTGWRKS